MGFVHTGQKPRATQLFDSLPRVPPAHQDVGPVLARWLVFAKRRLSDRPAAPPSPHLPGK